MSIVTCTNRSMEMDNIFNNYSQQRWKNKELIIILNREDMEIEVWEQRAEEFSNVSVFQLPEKVTLGECLNFAVNKAKYDIIAKFDGDDYYSPYYIDQAMQLFKETGADIIGKSQLFFYFLNSKILCNRNLYTRIAGATIIFQKRVFKTVQFPKRNIGEDVHFLKAAIKTGFSIYTSKNPYNYVCLRKDLKNHTWKVPEKRLLRNCSKKIKTDNYVPHVIQAPKY